MAATDSILDEVIALLADSATDVSPTAIGLRVDHTVGIALRPFRSDEGLDDLAALTAPHGFDAVGVMWPASAMPSTSGELGTVLHVVSRTGGSWTRLIDPGGGVRVLRCGTGAIDDACRAALSAGRDRSGPGPAAR